MYIYTHRPFLLPFKRPHERVADKDLTNSFEDASGVVALHFVQYSVKVISMATSICVLSNDGKF